MNKIILSAIFFVASIAISTAQTPFYDFTLQNGNAVWQRVYEIDADSIQIAKQIQALLNSSHCFKNITASETTFFDLEEYLMDYKKAGGSYMSTSMLVSGSKWFAKGSIEIKTGKYRVTINGLSYDAGTVNSSGLEIPITGTINEVLLNKRRDKFKPGQAANAKIISQVLYNQFLIPTNNTLVNDDW